MESIWFKSNLYLYDMDKECGTSLKSAKNPSNLTWSPDGTQIAFISDTSGIYTVDVPSGNSFPEGCR
jgi:Tol biopolymer transport system component